MIDSKSVISRILIQILSLNSPEPGARLKQRLKQALVSSGYPDFNEHSLGYKKFTDYLQSEHGADIKIVKPEGSGDVHVYLRNSPDINQHEPPMKISAFVAKPASSIRNDLWQAFVNPDAARRRFFQKDTGRIIHFLNNSNAPEQLVVEQKPDQFIEIFPISGAKQIKWMKDFLSGTELLPEEASKLNAVISNGNYTNAIGSAFKKALGKHEDAWKGFRFNHVISEIRTWAADAKIDQSKFYERLDDSVYALPAAAPITSPKLQVQKLLELLSDEDVSRFVLPLLLSTIHIKSNL